MSIGYTQGDKTPIFLIHPARGLSFSYSGLANFITDRKIYGINHPFYSNEEMASYYADIIKSMNKNKPCILGGWSFGGYVALEVANILNKENVESVILFDISNYPKEMILDLTEEDLENGLKRIGVSGKQKESDFFKKNSIIANDMTKKYIPKVYDGRVILVKAQGEEYKNDFRKNDIYQGWYNILNNIEIYSVKGEHNFMWHEENIDNVASAVYYALNKTKTNTDILSNAIDYNDDFMIERISELKNSKVGS